MMIKLTDIEKKVLQGDSGRLQQKALENIISYAEALGAEELCKVTKATLGLGAQPYLNHIQSDDYNKIFSRVYMCTDEVLDISHNKFSASCFCMTCTENCDTEDYEEVGLTQEYFDKNGRFLEFARAAGVSMASTCAPYLLGWLPLKGEHFVTTESSNAMFCNSLLGACGNPDGVEAAAWSAICGRTPKWGLHCAENRYATHEFKIQCPAQSATDWDLIGYTIGRMLPAGGIPVITGDFDYPTTVEVKQLFASIATTSGAVMCHILGMTPEGQTMAMATGGHGVKESFQVSEEEYRKSLNVLCDAAPGPVDFISLGCPHYTLEEIRDVADYLCDKKIMAGVRLYIWTAYPLKEMARASGYLSIIENAGGRIMTSSCPIMVGESIMKNSRGVALDGAKQAHYIRSMTDVPVYFGDKYRCLDTALTGKWDLR
ncbi:aconitase X catalytic domain-containing protein [uncultured Desulfuromusa sp.]|uniref:aconitase X catalytic domain-containing protein n=1 Tax=uncultured Desulfuromusa sp. TaxID=219183 RepID=UPI002AA6BEC6|nr:aconitase X catalytic domain-containing protein [uncultured Desulfuromusa sp.]